MVGWITKRRVSIIAGWIVAFLLCTIGSVGAHERVSLPANYPLKPTVNGADTAGAEAEQRTRRQPEGLTDSEPVLRFPYEPDENLPSPKLRKRPNRGWKSEDTSRAGTESYGESPTNAVVPDSAVDTTNRQSFNVGIQYPGITLGLRRRPFSVELKLLHDNDITILGGRLYHHALSWNTGNLYWAMDGSAIQFEGSYSEGDGISTGLVGGVERFMGDQLSWKVDVGPYYTVLEDDNTGIDEDGLEFVVTTALSFHFGFRNGQ